MLEQAKKLVFELLEGEASGHGNDHIIRVFNLAIKFAKNEGANEEIVGLAALLHDADDYKLVGKDQAKNLTNTKAIMKKLNISQNKQQQVLSIIKNMGYSNYLENIRPITLEGKIVSDADMCDAIGASGIIRSVVYAVSKKGNGIVFNREVFPNINITIEEYNSNETNTTHGTDSAINHFFEKLLKLSDIMMTKSGSQEAIERQKIMVKFLIHFFNEENAPEWLEFLNNYLANLSTKL